MGVQSTNAARRSPAGRRAPVGGVLPAEFFARPALVVARQLLGKHLVRRIDGRELSAPIGEVEAYVGPHDRACHAHRGRTERTSVMFGPAGHWYVYFIYGVHWMLNIVTGPEDYPAAVLIRGAGDWTGPGKLTKALAVDKTLNGRPATPETGLWIAERGIRVPARQVQRTPRIGVDYAGPWAARPYRFVWQT